MTASDQIFIKMYSKRPGRLFPKNRPLFHCRLKGKHKEIGLIFELLKLNRLAIITTKILLHCLMIHWGTFRPVLLLLITSLGRDHVRPASVNKLRLYGIRTA